MFFQYFFLTFELPSLIYVLLSALIPYAIGRVINSVFGTVPEVGAITIWSSIE